MSQVRQRLCPWAQLLWSGSSTQPLSYLTTSVHQTNQKVGSTHFQQNIAMPDRPCTHEYYKWFIPNEEQKCHCSNTLQTQSHILFKCKTHSCHSHLLVSGRNQNIDTLLAMDKGINN